MQKSMCPKGPERNGLVAFYDADRLVNLKDETKLKRPRKLQRVVDKIFLTETGKTLAYKIYL